MHGGLSSSVIVAPTAWPSLTVTLTGVEEVDEERLVGLVERVADHGNRDRLVARRAAKVSVPVAVW